MLVALGLVACGSPPVLEVGPVGYSQEDLATVEPSRYAALARLTAFALAIAENSTDELVEPRIQADLRSIVLQRVAMELTVDEAGIGEEALRAAYAEDPRHELTVRHLVIISERWRPEEHRDSARARAGEALDRARAGEPFEALAGEYSDEPGAAERGGLLEPGRDGSWVPEFWDAASSLEEGELSDVVETEFGFHVIRLEERQPVPFEEVRDDVVESLIALPEALDRASEWVAAIQAERQVDTQAVLSWRDGDEVSGPLIRWPDTLSISAYGAPEVERYILTFRPESMDEIRDMDDEALLELVEGTTRTHIMLERARREGIEPSASQRRAIHQRWEDQVARWATALGFRRGMSRTAVKDRALRALDTQEQSAAIARSELTGLAGSLERLYPVARHDAGEDVPEEEPASGDGG